MTFSLESIKENNPFSSPALIFAGKMALSTVGGMSVLAISFLALKVLMGFEIAVSMTAVAIPITLGLIATGILLGAYYGIASTIDFANFRRRQ